MTKKRIITSLIVLVIILVGTLYTLHSGSTNNIKVDEVVSLVEKQMEYESVITSDGYTLDNPNVMLNPYKISPLTALVAFETSTPTTIKVKIVGKDELTTYEHTFSENTEHYIPIYGLYADTNNEVIIESETQSKTIYIQTEPLPDNFVLPLSVEANYELLSNDLYFFTPSAYGHTSAYDVNGDVRWYLLNYDIWKIDRLANGRLLLSTERLINAPYYLTGLYEMDMLGKVYVEYSMSGGYHHDYFEMPNGNLLVASDDFDNNKGSVEDYIVEIDRQSGEIVKSFDLKDLLVMEDGKSDSWVAYDWFHNNSVWYDEATNSITLSGRHQDAVINIDYASGKLNWIIGDSTNWSEEYKKYFFTPIGDEFEWQWSQHAAMITPEGYVFIFDNGNNKSKIAEEYVSAKDSYSRGVMYKINTDDMTIQQVYQYGKERGSDYYSPYISDVDYLASNHYIIHSGGISYKEGEVLNVPASLGGADTLRSITSEVLNNEVIFEIVLPTNNYRVEKMSLYPQNTKPYELLEPQRLGNLGKTLIEKQNIGFMMNAKAIDEEYEAHNITFTKEIDRLVMSGQFTKGESVKLVLYQNGQSFTYNVVVSVRPYTAMCVFIFNQEPTDELINVTKYINEVDLSGKYSIYVELNGVLYNTNTYVEY